MSVKSLRVQGIGFKRDQWEGRWGSVTHWVWFLIALHKTDTMAALPGIITPDVAVRTRGGKDAM